ncbi:MAG: nitrite/sulfite reductase [Candidatus Omnitrophica bacterium]|nr:nitrite/sulfite reductase [Candidatus Omnitrophota bacterium]
MRDTAIVEAELRHLETQIERLERGELDPELFKKLRLQYGIYSMRRAPAAYMVRVRVPLGIITPEQLEAFADACDTFTPTHTCHLTTRQDAQLYGVERHRVTTLLRRLAGVWLTTREASGNVVRNVTLCPWAGVAPDEPFDITPYAQAVSGYLLRNPLTQILPRKVKVAFEGCPTDHARIAIHDIGIAAALHKGQPGFRVYVGGGLGPTPRAAQLLEPWTSAEYLLPTIEAVLRVFDRHGERKNRARARLKFLVEQLGWSEVQRRVLEERQIVWATQSGHALTALNACPTPQPTRRPVPSIHLDGVRAKTIERWLATNATEQQQPGFACVIVRAPCGDMTSAQLRGVAQLAREYANGVRLTNEQNLMLRGVRIKACAVLYEALKTLGLAEPGSRRLMDVTRCPGAESCLSAITSPRGLAEAIERLCRNGLSAWADAPLSIKISGCPNSCGHHHIADIGFFGVALKVGQRHVPCYQILVGGRTAVGQATFGQRLARVPAQRAPEAIKRIVTYYFEQRQPEETFAAFVDRVGLAPLQAVVQDLTDHTDAARDPTLFVDLGTTEPFELEAGKGECAE